MSVKYNNLQGLGELERSHLSNLLRLSKGPISISDAEEILKLPRISAAKILSKYAQKGWLTRIAPGVYIPVPIESNTADISPENPIGITEKLFSPCYISGWTAAEHWGLTEQIFQSIIVIIQEQRANYRPVIQGTEYCLYLSSKERFFGFKKIWRGNVQIHMADPSRLMLDLVYRPEMGGGIRSVSDFFSNYLSSEKRNIPLLSECLEQFDSGVACKRLGFLAEKYCPEEKALIELCHQKITKGYSKLDPGLECTIHLSRWNLLIPESWQLVGGEAQ